MVIAADVLSVDRRMREGDPTLGWAGDERLYTVFNRLRLEYEVWRSCEDGQERVVMRVPHEEFDTRVLRRLSASDTRYRDVIGDVERQNRQRERSQDRELDSIVEEMSDVMLRGLQGSYLPGVEVPSHGSRPLKIIEKRGRVIETLKKIEPTNDNEHSKSKAGQSSLVEASQ